MNKEEDEEMQSTTKKITVSIKTIWGIIAAVVVVSVGLTTLYINKQKIDETNALQKDKFIKEKFDTGHLEALQVSPLDSSFSEPVFTMKSNGIIDSSWKLNGIYIENFFQKDSISFDVAQYRVSIPTALFRKEVDLHNLHDKIPPGINGVVVGNHLYLSLTINDIEDSSTIGWMQYNHWKLIRSKTLWYFNDDKRLEVYDSHHNIALCLEYKGIQRGHPEVLLGGYFMYDGRVDIIGPDGNYQTASIGVEKPLIIKEIKKIKSIFKKPVDLVKLTGI